MKFIENIYTKFGWCCKTNTIKGSKINILEVMENNDINHYLKEHNISYKYYDRGCDISDLGFWAWSETKGCVFKKDNNLFLIRDHYYNKACIKCFRCHSEMNKLLSRFEEMKNYFSNINIVDNICEV